MPIDGSSDWTWTTTITDLVAQRARDILYEVVKAFDEMRSIIEIPAYPADAGPNPAIGSDGYWIQEQANTALMLRKRGILTEVRMEDDMRVFVSADEALAREAHRRLSQHLDSRTKRNRAKPTTEGVVFVGHGRSRLWLELQSFLQGRLKLRCVEFNSESAAGKPNVVRLEEMLSEANFAFLLLTAEDRHRDGSQHARENVVHETGLFQGRLGFDKAIVLLEDGCEEFGNIHGLVQIRFPQGDLSPAFERIRMVLEREGVFGIE